MPSPQPAPAANFPSAEAWAQLVQDQAALRLSLEALQIEWNVLANERKVYAAQEEQIALIVRQIHLNHENMNRHNARLAALQDEIDRSLNETYPQMPRFLRTSGFANYLFRSFKRLSRLGKHMRLQREWNDAARQSLDTLSHLVVLTGSLSYNPGQVRFSVPQLMEALRQRLP